MNGRELACLVLLLTAQSIVRADGPRPLIVVADSCDVEATERIGGACVEVAVLFPRNNANATDSYDTSNARAKRLCNFVLYLARIESSCPMEAFWRERLTTANPRGHVRRLPRPRDIACSDYQKKVRQARQVHQALATVLPRCKSSLDENLTAELQRLRWLCERPDCAALASK